MKICYKCKIEKNKDVFYLSKKTPDGFHSWCKQCFREYAAWKKKNDPKYIESLKKSYEKYSKTDKAKEKSKRNHLKNQEKEKEQSKKYYRNNTEKRKSIHYLWVIKNKVHVKNYKIQYLKKRNEDPVFKFMNNLRHRIRAAYKSKHIKKTQSIIKLLPYTKFDLKNHLNQFLNQKCNRCQDLIIDLDNSHIDHIIPLCLAKNEEEVINLNKLENLQLLCAGCNMRKGKK